MPAPRMRDISISRANPAILLTRVSPPIVPVDLIRFMRLPAAPASGFGRCVGRRRLARAIAAFASLAGLRLELRDISAGEIDRVEQERREAGVGHRVSDDLASEWEDQPRRFDQKEWRKG